MSDHSLLPGSPPRGAGARSTPRSPSRVLVPLWFLGMALASSVPAGAEEPPEVVRIRVPSAKVTKRFPAGTDLRGLPADQFEALVKAARKGAERRSALAPPRLLRARHLARWDP